MTRTLAIGNSVKVNEVKYLKPSYSRLLVSQHYQLSVVVDGKASTSSSGTLQRSTFQ